MPDINAEESSEFLAPPEIRHKALEMLRSRGHRALREVEELLGWESSIGMFQSHMDRKLGVTIWQLQYMLFRDKLQKDAKERRIAEKKARNIDYKIYTSSKLKFSIAFPADWRVTTDVLWAELDGITLEQAYAAFSKMFPDSVKSMEDYKRERDELEAQRSKSTQMELGLFQAILHNSEDDLSVEVTKLEFTKPRTAIELYESDKPPEEQVPIGNRPSKGINLDGLHGVKYYYVFNTGETNKMWEMPKFFNVYLTENKVGWIISCSCKEGAFKNYKPVFESIISSFQRI